MSCDYCFYCDETKKRDIPSYGMMSEETLEKLIRRAMRQAGGEICFAFQGGEPTLRGIEFYQKAVELEAEIWQRPAAGSEYDPDERAGNWMRDGAGCSGIIIFWWGYPWTGSGKSMTDTAGTVPEGLPTSG